MRLFAFVTRNIKEILRDKLSLAFGFGLPILMLLIFSLLQKNIPASMFEIKNLAPAIAVFSFSFISLLSGMLIAKDRQSSFLMRIFASPLSPSDYILGYALPLLPIALLQTVVCYIVALFFGLSVSLNMLLSIVVIIPTAILYIGFGLLFGSIFNEKQVGGIFALFINISGFMSGVWFDFTLIGGAYETICYLLPFAHGVDATRAAFNGDYKSILLPLLWVTGYALIVFVAAILVFNRKRKQ